MARQDVTLKRISPLSAFRVGLAFALVGLVAWLLAVSLLWLVMDNVGIIAQVNSLVMDVGGDFTVTFGVALSLAALFGAVMALLVTIVAPLLAVIYNAVVDLFGGLVFRLTDY